MSVELLSSDNKEATQKKIPCRYGRGCTHIQDPFHKERYDHPEIPVLESNILIRCPIVFLIIF